MSNTGIYERLRKTGEPDGPSATLTGVKFHPDIDCCALTILLMNIRSKVKAGQSFTRVTPYHQR